MTDGDIALLLAHAQEAQHYAYAPYSCFAVGAALCTDKGVFYQGCNVENSAYGLTNCAERTAIFKAVSEGHTPIVALAVTGNTQDPITPCGACRQVMAEFATPDTPVWLTNAKGDRQVTTVGELLPGAFALPQRTR